MRKTFKLLLAFAVVGLFSVSCGDDETPSTPQKNKNYLKVGETQYDLELGALTSNSSDAQKTRTAPAGKFTTPVAFTTKGLSFGQGTDTKKFEVKGEGQLFVLNLYSSSLTSLDEGTHTISKDKSVGMTLSIKIIDEKTQPEVSKIAYVNEGTVEVKKSGEEYEITIKCKGLSLDKLGSLAEIKKLVEANDYLKIATSLETINIEGYFKGKLLTYTNVDWSKYMDLEKYSKYLEYIKGLPGM